MFNTNMILHTDIGIFVVSVSHDNQKVKRAARADEPSESYHLTLQSFSLLFQGFNKLENTVEHLAAKQPVISLQEMLETNNRVVEDQMLSFGGQKHNCR